MNEHADYYLARIPEPTTILGLKLRPFSLGHLVLLHRIKSFFAGEDEALSHEDLALSVLICSQTYEQAIRYFDDPDLPRFMKLWADKLTGRCILTRLGLRQLRIIPLEDKAADFAAYMQRGVRKLTYAIKSEGEEIPLPLVQIVRVTLLQEFGGLTDGELMDRPWGLCIEDYITINTLKGNVRMFDPVALDDAQAAAKAAYEKLVLHGRITPPSTEGN